jgi:AcrR family transcriptional regulator
MARPTTITDDQILEAARVVFLEKGIQGTTAEVAHKAGVAEGTIFKRFPTKQELFHKAMEREVGDPGFLRKLPELVGQGDLRQNLLGFSLEALAFFRKLLPAVMTTWGNRKSGLPAILNVQNPPPVRVLKRISAFFEAEMRLGRLRRSDPEILARLLLGSIQNYVFFEMLQHTPEELPIPDETYLKGVINLLWNGAGPTGEDAQ